MTDKIINNIDDAAEDGVYMAGLTGQDEQAFAEHAAKRRQNELEQMHAGDMGLILKNVHRKSPFCVMSALLAGAKHKVTLPEFLAGVEAARNNETVFLGIRVKEMAEATWYYVQGFRYDGENDTVKRLISELPKI